MPGGAHSPEGEHFLGIGGSAHIGSPGGQNMHGAHMGSIMQGPMQATMFAGLHWPIMSQAIIIGGGGHPPSTDGSHIGLQSSPQ